MTTKPQSSTEPELKPCAHCDAKPIVQRAESGVCWVGVIKHRPNCFWFKWMDNMEQVIMERAFQAWNARVSANRVALTVDVIVEAVANFDDWEWCKCSECIADAHAHAVDTSASLSAIVALIRQTTTAESVEKE